MSGDQILLGWLSCKMLQTVRSIFFFELAGFTTFHEIFSYIFAGHTKFLAKSHSLKKGCTMTSHIIGLTSVSINVLIGIVIGGKIFVIALICESCKSWAWIV